MSGAQGEGPWIDGDAGRLVRPYTVSNGRTRPALHFDLMTLVTATGGGPHHRLGPDHALVLQLCGRPVSVVEIAAHLQQPVVVTKVLLSDLLESGAVTCSEPTHVTLGTGRADRELLEAVLEGLRKRL